MLSSIAMVGKELCRVGVDRVLPDASTLPDTGRAVTPGALERLTSRPPGSIRDVRVLDEHHGTAGRVRVAVDSTAEADVPDTLFLKVTPHNVTQRLMMSVFALGTREVLFYSAVAPGVPVRVPRCYGTALDERRGRNVIVLEDLEPTATFRDIRDPASADEAAALVDGLADLHAAFWASPRFAGDLAPLRARAPAAERLGHLFVARVLGNLRGRSAEVTPEVVQRDSRILFEKRTEIDWFWSREPQTLCHGDPHLGNLFFEGDTPGFLDWQACMMGPGIRDVSYCLCASVDVGVLEGIERDLVERYAKRLASLGIETDAARTWSLYRASAAEFYIAAIVTAGTADRMQPPEISRVGVDRAVAAMRRLATFSMLRQIVAGAPL
jgi:aminoglycoside phosphotransferase (APT) family kinase protein